MSKFYRAMLRWRMNAIMIWQFCPSVRHAPVVYRNGLTYSIILASEDYGSATLAGLPAVQLDRLQSVLNAAARLIYRRRKFDHVSPLLKELHWLRVPERITFRLAVLAYRCQHNTAPCYLTASSTRRAMLVTGIVYARRRRPCSMFLTQNTWPSVAMRSVQLQLVCGTVCQRQCSLLSYWTFFNAAWKLNCSSCSYNWHRACQTTLLLRDSLSPSRSFLLWPQPWSLSTIMLLWHSFLIIIIIICLIPELLKGCGWIFSRFSEEALGQRNCWSDFGEIWNRIDELFLTFLNTAKVHCIFAPW